MHGLQRGDKVRLIGVPDWLLHDLPKEEQAEIVGFVGGITEIVDTDAFGYFWVEFGYSCSSGAYAGRSFCVTGEYLQKVD
jgi:hypothetical protein